LKLKKQRKQLKIDLLEDLLTVASSLKMDFLLLFKVLIVAGMFSG
jgi:hypothetical protein